MALARATSTVPVPVVGQECPSSLHFDRVPLPGRTGDSDPAVLVEATASDVMAGVGGAAGPGTAARREPC